MISPSIAERSQSLNLKLYLPESRPSIAKLLENTVLLGGKRLRASLTYLSAQANGLPLQKADPFARMIERIHAASIAHDDVIDEAQRRRDGPSINALSSNKEAILAGDYLLSDVIVELARFGNLQIMEETARVIMDITEGEWRQLEMIRDRSYSLSSIIETFRVKTASTMQWCCVVPAILANASTEVQGLWRDFGLFLGLGFQMIDDILDFQGSGEKTTHSDLENGLINSVLCFWLDRCPEAKKAYTEGASLVGLWDPDSPQARESLAQAKIQAQGYFQKAEGILEKLKAPDLVGLVHFIRDRKH